MENIVRLNKSISISDFSGITSDIGNVTMLHGMTLQSLLVFEQVLSQELYVTLKGTCDNKDVVIKFFYERSDKNNEFEIMRYVEEETSLSGITPIPYIKIDNPKYSTYKIGNIKINGVWKIIIYEYIPGVPLEYLVNINVISMQNDIRSILSDLEYVGLVYGDIHLGNIIQINNGRYRLIDFGQSFSTDNRFPPIEYMLHEDLLPTFSSDINNLSCICNNL